MSMERMNGPAGNDPMEQMRKKVAVPEAKLTSRLGLETLEEVTAALDEMETPIIRSSSMLRRGEGLSEDDYKEHHALLESKSKELDELMSDINLRVGTTEIEQKRKEYIVSRIKNLKEVIRGALS